MVISLSLLLLLTACGLKAIPAVRRALGKAPAPAAKPVTVPSRSVPAHRAPIQVVVELPKELRHLPEPPVLQAAPAQILDKEQVFQRLRELELGVFDLGEPSAGHENIIAAALAAIGDADTQRRYSPRRPNLLPQLMRAINDEDVSRRELSAIIARDPALVGSLLKMANSVYYRVSSRQVESIERAVVILGSEGLRSLIAAALMQPIFKVPGSHQFLRFPELVWEHALRSAHAAIPHAALVERTDAFAAELLCLITGLAEIVLFRAVMDHFNKMPNKTPPDPQVIASLLTSHAATFAWRLGHDWELSETMMAALEEQMSDAEPTTPLARSLRFGRCAGALAVLHTNSLINDATVRLSLPEAGLSAAHLKCMWSRLLHPHEDPRVIQRKRVA